MEGQVGLKEGEGEGLAAAADAKAALGPDHRKMSALRRQTENGGDDCTVSSA